MQMMTVFSVDGSRYHRWQADLLAYSHRRAGQPGQLLRLWSAYESPTPFAGHTFKADPYAPHPVSGDWYVPYNKPRALLAWLQATPPSEETVLLVDPDCIFIAPLAGPAQRGYPVAQPLSYMNPADHQELITKHCLSPARVQGVGIPLLIHRDDLAAVVEGWLAKTEAIRNDPRSRELAGWIAEMWGYVFAAAEIGLHHLPREMAQMQTDARADLPLIHYCYSSSDSSGQWTWDKRHYRPWDRVPAPPASTPLASVALIRLLNEYGAVQGHPKLY